MDTAFFVPIANVKQYSKPFILTVGMDLGRDYETLLKAIDGIDVDLKIVTLPYLLEGMSVDKPNIQIFSKIPYRQLFELYSESLFVVIPLKKWATQYSSGTTNLLEAKLLGKTVISTHSKPLTEYLENENGVYYVEAENVSTLRQTILNCLQDLEFCRAMQNKGREVVAAKYNTFVFAQTMGKYLGTLVYSKGYDSN